MVFKVYQLINLQSLYGVIKQEAEIQLQPSLYELECGHPIYHFCSLGQLIKFIILGLRKGKDNF